MALVLAFESSAAAASVAAVQDGKLIAQFFLNCGLTHSETLLPLAEDILRLAKIERANIDKIAVAAGPGSFTGIRIGIAAAEGFAWGLGKPIAGVSTLEAMAYGYPSDGLICPAMDARRNEVYTAIFEKTAGVVTRVTEDMAISSDKLAEIIAAQKTPPVITGDGAHVVTDRLTELGIAFMVAPEGFRLQTAYGVALAAEHAEAADKVTPNYLRLSQAERLTLQLP